MRFRRSPESNPRLRVNMVKAYCFNLENEKVGPISNSLKHMSFGRPPEGVSRLHGNIVIVTAAVATLDGKLSANLS